MSTVDYQYDQIMQQLGGSIPSDYSSIALNLVQLERIRDFLSQEQNLSAYSERLTRTALPNNREQAKEIIPRFVDQIDSYVEELSSGKVDDEERRLAELTLYADMLWAHLRTVDEMDYFGFGVEDPSRDNIDQRMRLIEDWTTSKTTQSLRIKGTDFNRHDQKDS